MITDIEQRSVRQELRRDTLADYWQGYFYYQEHAPELFQMTADGLNQAIDRIRNIERPFVDSQQIIGKLLTEFGNTHNFHRQFREQFPDLHANQILGMHLYDIMTQDEDTWVYTETQHQGHQFPHATYFMPR